MSLYRLSVRVISRGNTSRLTARNVVAASAYNAREAIYDEQQECLHNYEHRSADLVHSEVLLPWSAPERWLDRATLWNEVEQGEWRPDAQLARSVILTLPRELPREANVELARGYLQKAFVGAGMVVDMAVHEKLASDGLPQPHAHALLTLRRIVDDAFGLKERAWNRFERLHKWREQWAETANRKLSEHGIPADLDHRRRWVAVAGLGKEAYPTQEQRDQARRRPIREAVQAAKQGWAAWGAQASEIAKVARGIAIIGAAVATQAMRDMARRMSSPKQERRRGMPLDTAAKQTPIDVLREELRRPLRTEALGVATNAWSYSEAVDRLVADHLLPATRRHPELVWRLAELAEKVGAALARGVERLEKQISGNAAILRERAELYGGNDAVRRGVREIPMAGRVDDEAYIAQASKEMGVADPAQVNRIMASPGFREMEAQVERRIAASATGEAGSLSVERREPTQAMRDMARQTATVPVEVNGPGSEQAQQAQRRAQSSERSQVAERG